MSQSATDSAAFFDRWRQLYEADRNFAARHTGRIAWSVAGCGNWEFGEEEAERRCAIEIAEEDLAEILAGDSTLQVAFLEGKLRIGGERDIALSVAPLFDDVLEQL